MNESEEVSVSFAVGTAFVLAFFLNLIFLFFVFDYFSFEFGKYAASFSNNIEVMHRAEACYLVTYLAPLNKVSETHQKEFLNSRGIDFAYCRNMVNLSEEFK